MAEGMTEPNDYLIWSDEHGAWWRANSCGYTESILYAGRYTESEAREICERANLHNENERMVKWGPELADLLGGAVGYAQIGADRASIDHARREADISARTSGE